jgi:hypothetical protein
MDYFFDELEGGLGKFDGVLSEIFRDVPDMKYSMYLNDYYKFFDDMEALVKKNKLNFGNSQRIAIYMHARRQDARERLIAMGIDEEWINAIKPTKEEMEFVKFADDILNEERPWLAKIAREIFNKEFNVLEDMFPMVADFRAAAEMNLPIQDRFGDTLPRIGMNEATSGKRSRVKEGTIKSRQPGATLPIQIDAIGNLRQHMENTFYMKHMAETIKHLGDVKNATKVVQTGTKAKPREERVNILREKVGDVGFQIINNYVDMLARKGGADGQRQIDYLSALNRNVGPATLAWKIATMFIQGGAIFNTAAATRSAGPILEVFEILANKRAREYIIKNFPEIRARIGDDIGFLEQADFRAIQRLNAAGWWGIQKLDRITAAAGALSVYKQELAKKGIKFSYDSLDMASMLRAQKIVRATQSSSAWKDAASALGTGFGLLGNRELNRMLLKFQSFGLADWNVMRTFVYRQARYGNTAKDKASAMWAFIMMALAVLQTVMVRRAVWNMENEIVGRDAEDDKRLDKGIANQIMLEVTQKIPFMSQLISSAVYDSEPVPVLSALTRGGQGAYRVIQSIYNEDARPGTREKGIVDVIASFATMGGFGGTAQLQSIIRALIDARVSESKARRSSNTPMGTPQGPAFRPPNNPPMNAPRGR